jgi:GntR family transcriptional regulator
VNSGQRNITGPIDIFGSDVPVPKHYRIREILRRRIQEMEAGEPLPTEAELCEAYSVSRTTVRKALERLAYEGLVHKVQGKGTFAAPPKLKGRYVQSRAGFYDEARARGLHLRTQVLEQSQIEAHDQVAAELGLRSGDPVMKLVRLRFVDEAPMLLSHSYVSEVLCPGISKQDFTTGSLYWAMRRRYGVQIHRGVRVIESALSDPEEARLLGLQSGAPLLVVAGTMYDSSGAPVEYGVAKHRADRSQVEIEVVTDKM